MWAFAGRQHAREGPVFLIIKRRLFQLIRCIAFFVRVVVWGWGWGWGGIVDRDVSQKNFEGNTDSDIHL